MTSKRCIACSQEKPLDGFYRHPKMADGHLNKCIECVKAYQAERQKQGKVREYERQRAQQPHRVTARKQYAQSESGKKARLRAQQKAREQQPEKHRARHQVAYALSTGQLQRQPCEVCGAAKAEAHHDDYSKPIDVRWLCSTHHAEHHRSEAPV